MTVQPQPHLPVLPLTSRPQVMTPLDHALTWVLAGQKVALATVVGTWGSSPRPAGSFMAISETGRVEGSVSGGCVETDVITTAQAIMDGAPAEILSYGVSSERAWDVGLACGGKLDVLVEAVSSPACPTGTFPLHLLEQACAFLATRKPAVMMRSLDAQHHRLLDTHHRSLHPDALAYAVEECLRHGTCQTVSEENGADWFLQPLTPPPRLLIVGAVHIAQHLAQMALMTGLSPLVIDPRTALATPERFPGFVPGETLITEWPDDALDELGVDGMTAIVTLTHDAKLDDPTLEAALRGPAFYIGALGSRKTQASRMKRLKEAGFSEQDLKRIHGPVGLAIGAVGAEEIALSILAEIVAIRRGAALAERPGW